MIASLSGGELASEACQKTDHADWEMLTIFAAAFAEAGNYDQAIYWCRHALHEAPLQDQPAIETMLAGFRNRTPCRW